MSRLSRKRKGAENKEKQSGEAGGKKPGEKIFHSRKHQRVPLEMDVQYLNGENYIDARSRDISVGGMYIASSRPLKDDCRTRVRFLLDKEKEAIEVEGRVAWTNEEEALRRKSHPAGMGVEFTEKDDGKRRVVKEFVRDLTDLLRIMAIANKRRDV